MARISGRSALFAPLALLSLSCLPARAQDCGSLTRLTSLDLAKVPGDGRVLVPVVINGKSEKLLLGTAGGLITLNQAAVQALDLHAIDTDKRLLDTAGNASRRYVRVSDFRLGQLHAHGVDLMITPDRKAGEAPPDDGVFDPGLSYHYDIEMDFTLGKLNYFLPAHCPGHVIYWPADAVGVVPVIVRPRADDSARHGGPQDVLPMMSTDDGSGMGGGGGEGAMLDPLLMFSNAGVTGADIQIKVTLDGREMTANLDTGLEYSTLNSSAAKALFDVTADSPGSAPVNSLGDNDANRKATGASETVTVFGTRAFAHTFHTLSFGAVTVSNPHFMVRPDLTGDKDPDNNYLTGSHVFRQDDNVEPDVSIGMDVLARLHLYFAFKEGRLYLTPAAPVAVSPG